ncbi:MAG: MgtC/SapB family protein [Nitrospinae bacterium]|jgi:putative Mg2+ transporter-C (MgtC) family protein|nr:MgtC/SapB family protein [Nitrospinota bacterium]MDA1110511.1 MgtC/SapB family protein [Nitrospinota bacterium]
MFSGDWFIDSSMLFRVFLSLVLGGAIGLEREMHGRPAGLRTHMMVCLGSAILMLGSEYSQSTLVATGRGVFDPDRVSAGIITGIGFLGAGAIMREGNMVRGLTTAGSIWFVAGLGIVIGKKFYPLAVCSTLAALTVLVLFRYVENWVSGLEYRDLIVKVDGKSYESVTGQCETLLKAAGINVDDKHLIVDRPITEIEIKYTVKFKKGGSKEEMVLEISRLAGVKRVIW